MIFLFQQHTQKNALGSSNVRFAGAIRLEISIPKTCGRSSELFLFENSANVTYIVIVKHLLRFYCGTVFDCRRSMNRVIENTRYVDGEETGSLTILHI